MEGKFGEFSRFRESDRSQNWSQFKDPFCYMCLASSASLNIHVITVLSLNDSVKTFNRNSILMTVSLQMYITLP